MSEEEVVVVGADIGTSNCVIAGIKDGNAFVVDIGLDNKTAPANCLIDEADDCVVSTRNISNPRKGALFIQHFKPFLGRTHPADGSLMQDIERWGSPCEIDDQGFPIYRIRGDNIRPEQPYALLIKYLVKMYQEQTHKTPTHFVLAVPAYWPAPRRQAALDAAKIAGIESEPTIASEPVAAVIGYTKRHPDIKGEKFVCIDIGGGTTDVASIFVNKERNLFVVNATAGNNDLGGEHCTMALADVCKGKMKGVDVSEHKLRHACEMAKTSGRYPMEIELNDDTRIKVTRSEYKNACQEFLKRLGDVIDKVLKRNEDVKVIVVGGAFRDEVIFEYCKNKIGRDRFIPPYSLSTSVAEGAAWIGQPNSGIVVRNSLNQSIGIDVQVVAKGITDKYQVVLERDRGLPTNSGDTFLPAPGGVTDIKIFQGENKKSSRNVHLFTYRVTLPEGTDIPLVIGVRENGMVYFSEKGADGEEQEIPRTAGMTDDCIKTLRKWVDRRFENKSDTDAEEEHPSKRRKYNEKEKAKKRKDKGKEKEKRK